MAFVPVSPERRTQILSGQITPQQSVQQEKKRVLGGYLPAGMGLVGSLIGGVGGGLGGSLAGGVGAIPGAVGGAALGGAGGTGAGVMIEDALNRLLYGEQYTPMEKLKRLGTEEAISVGSDLFTAGLGRVARPVAQSFKGVPSMLAKLGFKETGQLGQRKFAQSALGTGKELAEEVIERNIAPQSERSLIQQADKGLNPLGPLYEKARQLPGVPNLGAIFSEAKDRTIKGLKKGSEVKVVIQEADEILERQVGQIRDWEDLARFKELLDKSTKGKAGDAVEAVRKKFNAELSNVIREKIGGQGLGGELADREFWTRIMNVVSKEGKKTDLGLFDFLPITMGIAGLAGGIGGYQAGGIPGALLAAPAASVAARQAFTPKGALMLSRLSQLIGKGASGLGNIGARAVPRVVGESMIQPNMSVAPQRTPTPTPPNNLTGSVLPQAGVDQAMIDSILRSAPKTAPGVNVPLTRTTDTIPSTGGMNGQKDLLNQLLAVGLVTGDISSSQVSALRDLGFLPQDKKDLTQQEKSAEDAVKLSQEALTLLQNYDIKTGPISAVTQGGLARLNRADQKTLEFNTLISGLKASIAKARAGTSFTPNEEKLLNQYVPVVGDSKQQLETKLRILQTPRGQSVLKNLMNPGTVVSQDSYANQGNLEQLLGQ